MKKIVTKIIWTSSEKIRFFLLPRIRGTPLHRLLQVPSKFFRKFDYRNAANDSIFYLEQEMEMCSLRPYKTLDLMIKRFGPKTVLDVGCGTGQAIDYLLTRGVDAIGLEGSPLAISKATHPERIIRADLNRPFSLNRKFDAVFCYEVAEHIHPDYLDAFLTTLCSHSDLIIMSHAQPGQGGEGHFNEQSDDYWIHQLSQRNFAIDQAATVEFKSSGDPYAENLLVFKRASPNIL